MFSGHEQFSAGCWPLW